MTREQKIYTGYGVALLLLIAVGIVSYNAATDLTEKAEAVSGTYRALAGLEKLSGAVDDVESSGQGYVDTGEETFLERYAGATHDIAGQLQSLLELTRDDEAQRHQLQVLSPLIRKRVERAKRVINLRKSSGFDMARRELEASQGGMDGVWKILDGMKRDEESRLAGSLANQAASATRAKLIIVLGSIFAVGTVGFAAASARIFRKMKQPDELDRMKNEFLSTVSHELRTPLTAMQASLALVAEGMTGDVPEEMKTMVDIAYRSTLRLADLIDDLLDVQRLESGTMAFHLSVVELLPIVQEAIRRSERLESRHGVKFLLKEPLVGAKVYGDKDRLAQVVTNILSNAAKYSTPHQTVDISMKRNNGSVRVSVTNAGETIPEEFRPGIFEKFTQADSSDTREKGGSGLGLSIAKGIIDNLGGRIDYHSDPATGTTFFFELPEWKGESRHSPSTSLPYEHPTEQR